MILNSMRECIVENHVMDFNFLDREVSHSEESEKRRELHKEGLVERARERALRLFYFYHAVRSVSYTHLTLPTIYSV